MSADFTPTMHGYTGQGAFKFWCQKVLPLVYDDSLSYYELLCKVVNYLNNVISDVSATESNVQSLYDSFVALQNYVNEYFENLDITDAVKQNVNIDFNEYVDSDDFKALVDEYIETYVLNNIDETVASQIDEVVAEQIDEVVAEQIDDIVDEKLPTAIGTEVTHWLTENVDPVGSAVTVDSSLSIAGSAADAKATGGAIITVSEDLESFEENIIEYEFQKIQISAVPSVEKVEGVSVSVINNPTAIQLNPLATYDSYYFYAPKNVEIYFDSASVADLTYVAIGILTNPSGTWENGEGGEFMRGSANARYRKIDNNLPSSSSKLSANKGTLICLTVPTGEDCYITINTKLKIKEDVGLPLVQTSGVSTDKAMSQKAITDFVNGSITSKKCLVKYETGTFWSASERLSIYIPTTYGYIQFWFYHYVYQDGNCNTWGIFNAYSVDDNLENQSNITTNGEWECAVHLAGRDDFSGGRMHGDEVYSNLYVFIDGKLTDIETLTTETEFSELRIVEDSVLYDPADSTSEIADHGREYIFTKDGLTINQSLKWKVAETLTNCYLAMFTPAKTVTNTYYTENDFIPTTIPAHPNIAKANVKKATIYSENSGFIADFSITQYPSGLTGGDKWIMTDNSSDNYNKMYYIVCTGGSSTVGELWESTSVYKLTKVSTS